MSVPLSVIIPVKNEGANLARCLSSLRWADQIFVVDSQSQDETVAIAQRFDAEVVQFHPQGPWPKKKNWALENLPLRHEWVLLIDADETLPPEAETEIQQIVTTQRSPHAGYWINRRFFFMGAWLKHAYYPNWNLRLFRHRLGRYEQLTDLETHSGDVEIHEHVQVSGSTGRLQAEMDHYAFPSVEVFVEKHNRYSNWEARLALNPPLQAAQPQSGPVRWRRALKQAARHLPGRPLLRFLYIYFFQLGFLDGWRGYYFARLHACYEFLSIAKQFELEQNQAPPSSAGNALRRTATKLLSWIGLALVLFFVLRPAPRGNRTEGLPSALGHWINQHDSLSNFVAFGVLGLFFLRKHPRGHGQAFIGRLVLFCLFVTLLESLQILIPGRVFDIMDIGTGCLGGLVATWVVHVLWFSTKPAPPA